MSLQLSSVRSDYTRVEAEVHKLRDENVKLGQNLHTSEKLVVGLQRDCERKDSEVASLEKTNAGLTQRVAVLESDIDDRKMQIKTGSGFIDEQRGKVAAARAECARLNEVIAGLQAEIQTLKDGHQRKNDVMKNMDAALKEGERRFKELDLQLDESKRAATDAQIEVKKLVAELDLQRVEISTMREEKINQKNVSITLRQDSDPLLSLFLSGCRLPQQAERRVPAAHGSALARQPVAACRFLPGTGRRGSSGLHRLQQYQRG
jgi:chromosome segregation ATPase